MIGKDVKKFCCEDLSLIENYEKAINDNTQIWHCHHRLEIQDGKSVSVKELKENNLYFHRPASELIFLTEKEHSKLHNPGKTNKSKVPINPAAFSKKQFVWLTPDKQVKFMNYYQVKKWHPDWKFLSNDPSKFSKYDIINIEN